MSKSNIQWTEATGRRLGRLKQLAKSIGVSVEQYQLLRSQGQKWCSNCQTWHPESAFAIDQSRYDSLTSSCITSRNRDTRLRYIPKPKPARFGPFPLPERDGDAKQARRRVNHAIVAGRIISPNLVPCNDCGHVWLPGERRHEYDHFLGYGVGHHLDVQAVCSRCHHLREMRRKVSE